MRTALRPRKGFQNLGFDGVLSALSFAAERKGAVGDIKTGGAGKTDCRTDVRTGLAMTWLLQVVAGVIWAMKKAPRVGCFFVGQLNFSVESLSRWIAP